MIEPSTWVEGQRRRKGLREGRRDCPPGKRGPCQHQDAQRPAHHDPCLERTENWPAEGGYQKIGNIGGGIPPAPGDVNRDGIYHSYPQSRRRWILGGGSCPSGVFHPGGDH